MRFSTPAFVHVAIAYILTLAAAFVLTGQTVIDGNPHDFFMPINAAYAMQSGGFAQDALRSPFGPLYFVLSANSFAVISAFPDWIQLDKIHVLSSLQFSLVTIGVFLAFRALQDSDRKLPSWVLMVALIVCFLPRSFDRVLQLYPDWYGTYNGHLWSILVIQAANRLSWRGRKPGSAKVFPLGMVEGLCLAICLNYKVSFFAASGILAVLSLCSLAGWRDRLTYSAVLLAVTGCCLLAFSMAGYSYPAYAGELRWAAEAKSLPPLTVVMHLVFFLAFAALFSTIRPAEMPGQNGMKLHRVIRHAPLRHHVIHASFSIILIAPFLVAALGDYHVPLWPYFVSILCSAHLYGYLSPRGWRAASARMKILLAGSLTVPVILLISAFTTMTMMIVVPDASGRQSPNHAGFRFLDADPLRFNYLQIPWDTAQDAIMASGPAASSPLWERNVIDLGYQDFFGNGEVLAEYLETLARARYSHNLNMTAGWLRQKSEALSPASKVVIGHVGFTNPWPFLTGNLFPKGTLHWMHLYTTVGINQLERAFEPLADADAVVLPAISLSQKEQTDLNCAFHFWNMRRGGEFVPQKLSGLNIVFLRRGGKLPPQEPPLFDASSGEIDRACGS